MKRNQRYGYGGGGEKNEQKRRGIVNFIISVDYVFPDHGAGHKYSQIEYPSLIPVCSKIQLPLPPCRKRVVKLKFTFHPFLLFLAKCHRPASRVPVPSLRNHVRLVDSASASAGGEGEGEVAVGGGREQGRW